MFHWINGPYRAVGVVVLVILVVLFGRDLLESFRVAYDIRRLSNTRQMLRQSIEQDSVLLRKLDDPDFLEKYAREQYLMRKPSEEVYIIMKK